MADRLIEVLVPEKDAGRVRGVIWRSEELDWFWVQSADGTTVFKLVVPAEDCESVLEVLDTALAEIDPARVLVLPVEAMLGGDGQEKPARRKKRPRDRISREELHSDLRRFSSLAPGFLVTTALSTVVAAIGFARDSATIIIAAMVIAPLLGPNMALALGVVLRDWQLVLRSVRANAAGVTVTVAVALVASRLWPVDVTGTEMVSRAHVEATDVALALAAGAAGALGAASVTAASLVGVMVAVALLPPLVAAVTFLAYGHLEEASSASLLLLTNVVCLNVAAGVSFYFMGFRPKRRSETSER